MQRRLSVDMLSLIRHKARYNGLFGLAWSSFERAVSPLGHVGVDRIYRKDVAASRSEVADRDDLIISEADERDIDQLMAVVESIWDGDDRFGPYGELGVRSTIFDRLQRGQRCYLAKDGATIVHYNWIATDWEEAVAGTGLIATLAPGREAVCHDGFTVESWRGKGVHPAVNNAMTDSLRAEGYERAYSVVSTFNRPSYIALERLEWRQTGTIFYFISRRTQRAHVWRIMGSIAPFQKTKTPRTPSSRRRRGRRAP